MKRIFTSILFLCALVSLTGCEGGLNPRNVKKVVFKANELEHTKSLSTYSFDVYNKEVLKQYNDKSVVFSPISHHLTLGMMLNSENNGQGLFEGISIEESNALCKKILERLSYREKDIVKSFYNCYIYNTLCDDPNVEAPILSEWFYADTYEEDFTNTGKVTNLFLKWINSHSKEIKLKELPILITPSTERLYSNVTNFDGKWSKPFEEKFTKKMDFTSINKSTRKVDMMNKKENLPYYEGEGIKAAELPYGENKYSMVVVMTEDGELSYEDWQLVQNGLSYEPIDLYLPKFTIETEWMDFQVPLANAFLLQVAKIEVDESGTKATAITIGGKYTDAGPPEYKEFKVDKTFHYIIREKETNVILFMGRYY